MVHELPATLILCSMIAAIESHTNDSHLPTPFHQMHSMPTNDSSPQLSRYVTGIFLYSLTIWTIIGNIFVCIAIATNRQLKQGGMSNFLIGNLALSDLLLGLTVLPFSATLSTFKKWLFGKVLCDLWLSIDVLCSTASIWGLLVISLDRYVATNHPIRYRKHKNNFKMALLYCTISWFISITISLGPLTVDPHQSGLKSIHNSSNLYQCVLFQTPSFVIISSLFSFYLPLVLMITLYTGVFLKIRQQSKLMFKTNQSVVIDVKGNGRELVRKRPIGHSHQHAAEAKVTKTLAIIMGVFVACWLPFFIVYIVRSQLSNAGSISDNFMDVFIWLGYFNSALNPILYAILNKNFRIAFSDIVVCRCFSKARDFMNKSLSKRRSPKSQQKSQRIQAVLESDQAECFIDPLGS
ncbi:alpha-1A adrenergic receptor [Brachionus plicatilis]|uniref:Alpha-1A adrenergic receptor n=1 Tax=Brachionus plicatilis TaxID=10195 RepID=A0A3M7S3I6_BRAPC|nr:alpha-1A adrenergic receptor [Brachionus plicatilis]